MYSKILLINPFGIGDVLFTTPVIHTLKDAYPGLKLGYLCNRRSADILKNNPYVDSVFIYERDEFEALRKQSKFTWLGELFSFLNRIKNEHFELALDFSLNTQYGFFCWYAGIKERLGYDFKGRGIFLTKKPRLTGYKDKHIVEYYADILNLLGIDLKYRNLELYLKKEDLIKAEGVLSSMGLEQSDCLVGIIPGAGGSWGKDASLKHWPPDNFARLADKLVENHRVKIIIMGDYSEREIAKKIIYGMRLKALDFSGTTTLGELAAFISKMRLVITNDGGPLHMAVALGTKTVSIFGPVDERVYGPYPLSQDHIVIKAEIPCRPCYKNFRLSKCKQSRQCIQAIGIDEVFEAAGRLL